MQIRTSADQGVRVVAYRSSSLARRAEYAALATAHLVQAVTQIVAIQQCRVLKAAPRLVQQVPVLPGGPQLTEQVTDRVHAAHVQQQPGGVPGDGQDARRG